MKVVRAIFITILSILKQEGNFVKQKAERHSPQLRHFVLLLFSLVIILAGCSTTRVRLPDVQEGDAIQLKNKSIVLLRLKADMNGESLDQFVNYCYYWGNNRFRLAIAKMDEGQFIKRILSVVSPSSEARKNGWMYFVLNPGSYYLIAIPPGSDLFKGEVSGWRSSMLNEWSIYGQHFRFHIPDNKPLVYIGSLSVSCKGKKRAFSTPLISGCSTISVTDQSGLARKISKVSFPQYVSISNSIMKHYDKNAFHHSIDKLVPMGIMTKCTKNFDTPVWVLRSAVQAAEPTLGLGLVTGGLGWVLLAPAGAVGSIKGYADKSKLQPCMQELVEEVNDFNSGDALVKELRNILTKNGVTKLVELSSQRYLSAQGPQYKIRSVLQLKIQRVELRECKKSTFCVEVAIYVRIKDVDTNKYLYDRILLYTGDLFNYFQRRMIGSRPYETLIMPYEIPIYESSECRNIDVYCGVGCCRVLREEINKALRLSVERVCQDLGLKP